MLETYYKKVIIIKPQLYMNGLMSILDTKILNKNSPVLTDCQVTITNQTNQQNTIIYNLRCLKIGNLHHQILNSGWLKANS